jgi:hypothetical protein
MGALRNTIGAFGVLLLMGNQSPSAQTIPVDSVPKADTLVFVPQMEQRPAGDVTNQVNLERHLIQNPTGALFKSMLVPGLGQMGNRRWFKAGLFMSLQTWFALEAIRYGQETHSLKAQFESEPDTFRRQVIHVAYGNRRSDRNKFVWFFGLATFVSMFDAYVDAHLSGSPTNKRNDQFTVEIGPDPRGGATAMLSLHF